MASELQLVMQVIKELGNKISMLDGRMGRLELRLDHNELLKKRDFNRARTIILPLLFSLHNASLSLIKPRKVISIIAITLSMNGLRSSILEFGCFFK